MIGEDKLREEITQEKAEDEKGSMNGQETDKITVDTETKSVNTPEDDMKESGYRSEINGIEVDFELQYRDRETDMQSIATRVTEDYVRRGNAADKIESIHVYLKPTDFTAYYVINNVYEGRIPLF